MWNQHILRYINEEISLDTLLKEMKQMKEKTKTPKDKEIKEV